MNKLFKRFVLCASVGIAIVVGGLLIQSCSSEFDSSLDVDDEHVEVGEYLDCFGEMPPEEELFMLDKAVQRIGKHFVVEDDTCYLTVHSGKGLNMSDGVFSMVKQMVHSMNAQYKAYLFLKENDMGIIIKNPFELRLPIVTTRVEIERSMGGNSQTVIETVKLNDEETTIVINAMRTSNGVFNAFVSAIAGKFVGNISSWLVAAYAGLTDSQLSKVQDDYARSGSTKGMTLSITTMYSLSGGIPYTSYQSNINK